MTHNPGLESTNLVDMKKAKRRHARDRLANPLHDGYILPNVCPCCGADVGYLDAETGQHIIDGNYCTHCGHRLR